MLSCCSIGRRRYSCCMVFNQHSGARTSYTSCPSMPGLHLFPLLILARSRLVQTRVSMSCCMVHDMHVAKMVRMIRVYKCTFQQNKSEGCHWERNSLPTLDQNLRHGFLDSKRIGNDTAVTCPCDPRAEIRVGGANMQEMRAQRQMQKTILLSTGMRHACMSHQ